MTEAQGMPWLVEALAYWHEQTTEAYTAGEDWVREEPPDLLDLIDAVAPLLSREDAQLLREAFDLCPIHHCDIAICDDDNDPECATYRAERKGETDDRTS